MSYAIFFDYNGLTIRLPTNPENIKTTSKQANEKYVVFGVGQVAIPTHMELREYSFKVELPHSVRTYAETSGDFKDCYYYLNYFRLWRTSNVPVRFIAQSDLYDDINSLVLIEDMTVTENAGEEGDKYVELTLLEYIPITKKSVTVTSDSNGNTTATVTSASTTTRNPNAGMSYTVQSGDTLWSIAKNAYGDGSKYTTIFDANTSLLTNPNLITAGIVLTIP
jgi:LysM repeat protein